MKSFLVAIFLSLSVSAAPAHTVEDLGWMSGCWVQTQDNRRVEEYWTPVRGGLLMGSGLTLKDGRVSHFEHMRIEAIKDVITFTAIPSGQLPASFSAVSTKDGEVVFENSANDFPQRVIYRRVQLGLHAAIEGQMNGKIVTIGFDYRPCEVN